MNAMPVDSGNMVVKNMLSRWLYSKGKDEKLL